MKLLFAAVITSDLARAFTMSQAKVKLATSLQAETSTSTTASSSRIKEMSKSLPFLLRPTSLDGTMAGDVGFDPFGFSTLDTEGLDLYWMREAEIKHCRVAMLAALGFVWVEKFGPAPGCEFADSKNQVEAYFQLYEKKPEIIMASGVLIALAEMISYSAIEEGRANGREPGDYKFDPLGLGKNPQTLQKYKLNEIKNGRLAMWGAVGMWMQALVTEQGALENLP